MHLTGKEYQMLELLSLRKGTTLTKEMFLNHLYGGMDEPELKIIDVFICKLRKKLANASNGKNYIETVWGRGYVLREPTRGRGAHPGLTDFTGAASGSSSLDLNNSEPRQRWRGFCLPDDVRGGRDHKPSGRRCCFASIQLLGDYSPSLSPSSIRSWAGIGPLAAKRCVPC